MDELWTDDWHAASTSFRTLAAANGAQLQRIPIGQQSPDGVDLAIDVAVLDGGTADRCVIVSSGLHGVEGIAGSAVQRAWLRQQERPGCRVVLVHGLNPFGFSWHRRADQDNVDLNRNFLLPDESFSGAPEGATAAQRWLAPRRPAARWDPLLPRLLLAAARTSTRQVRQIIGGGQYDWPESICFGGTGPAPLQRILRDHLPGWVGGAPDVIHLDIHTGIGPPGTLQLLLAHLEGSPEAAQMEARFGDITRAAREEVRYYRVTGGLGPWCRELLPGTVYRFGAAEFGTVSALRVAAALHQENRAWFHGERGSASSRWARQRFVDAFAPPSPQWRRTVTGLGVQLIQDATSDTSGGSDVGR